MLKTKGLCPLIGDTTPNASEMILSYFTPSANDIKMAQYSIDNGTCLPGASIEIRLSSAPRRIAFCCCGLLGAPALAPIGTMGETPRGAPQRMEMAGSAEMMMVGIPDPSTAL